MTTYDLKFTANGAVIGLHEQITFQQRVWWCFRCRLNTWNRDWCRCTCADLPNRLLLCVHSPLQKTTQVTHFTALILHLEVTVYAHKVVRKFLIKLANVKFVSLAVVFRFRRCLIFMNAFHLHSCNVQATAAVALLCEVSLRWHRVFLFLLFLLSVLELQFMRIRMYISLFALPWLPA